MFRYILKRIGLLILTMIIIITVVFFLLRLMDGYPKAIETAVSNAKTSAEADAILAAYNPEPNAFLAYFNYMGNAFQGNFGVYYDDVTKTIPQTFFSPMKYTMLIVGPGFLIGTLFGTVFGFISGYKRGKWQDVTVNVVATLFVSVPSFVLATFLIVFGHKMGLPISFTSAQRTGETLLAVILPIFIIAITSFSTLTYYIRNEVVTVLSSDFIVIARAKGVSEKGIFFKHILRNVSLPFITIVFPSFLGIIFGSMIIEMFFEVPGSASVFSTAVTKRETNIIMFSTMFFTAFSLLIQLLIDVLYVVFDPRISMGQKSRLSISKRVKARISRKKELKEVENA